MDTNKKLNRKISVAPMMDCTDRHDRFFLRLMSKNVLLYTEMVATKSAIHGDRKKILSYSPEEKPLALQIGGSNKEELAEKISERVRQEFSDSKVAGNASKLKKLSNASIAGFGSAKKIQSNPKYDYNPNQPDGYPSNTTDGVLVRDTLSTQLREAEESGDKEAITHAKNELYEFKKNAADKSITGKEGDADTTVIYRDNKGRDRVCYISNKQSLNDQQSSGTIGSSKKSLTFAANRLGLSENEKQDVLTIAQEQFDKANQFDETFAQGVKSAVEKHKQKLSTPQAQKAMAKAAQALSGILLSF